MQQVLFHIPISWLNSNWADIPVYGYGLMLFFAFWYAYTVKGWTPEFLSHMF